MANDNDVGHECPTYDTAGETPPRVPLLTPPQPSPTGGGGRTVEDWITVVASRYRYLRNTQRLFPRKDSLPRGGGWGGGSKPTSAASLNTHAKHTKKPKYTNQPSDMKEMPSTPSPALLRAPRKMQSHFAWEPARCGLRPAREGAVRRKLQTFIPASATRNPAHLHTPERSRCM